MTWITIVATVATSGVTVASAIPPAKGRIWRFAFRPTIFGLGLAALIFTLLQYEQADHDAMAANSAADIREKILQQKIDGLTVQNTQSLGVLLAAVTDTKDVSAKDLAEAVKRVRSESNAELRKQCFDYAKRLRAFVKQVPNRDRQNDLFSNWRAEGLGLRAKVLDRVKTAPKMGEAEEALTYGILAGMQPLSEIADYIQALGETLPK